MFEWDARKAKLNEQKHGVTFHEAATVFDDPLSRTFDDPDHSIGEHRFIIIGHSTNGRLLFVSHTDDGKTVRIISGRMVTLRERKYHEER
ncbi:MAG: BrnT family toxin [Pyrinomonadaceae bacterium]